MGIDKLRLLRNKPVSFEDRLFLHQPTLDEISDELGDNGDQEYYNSLWLLCSAAYDMPSFLYDSMKKNFMNVSDWEFFRIVAPSVNPDVLALILKEADGSGFSFYGFGEYEREENGKKDTVLYRPETIMEDGTILHEMLIDEDFYKKFIPTIQEMIGFAHTGKKAGNKTTLKLLIDLDRKDRAKAQKRKGSESSIFNMVISLVNTEECKYNYETIFDLTLYQILKSYQQIQGKKAAIALLQGSCSGFVDTSKIPKDDMSWVYSDEKYKPRAKKLVNDNTKTSSKSSNSRHRTK